MNHTLALFNLAVNDRMKGCDIVTETSIKATSRELELLDILEKLKPTLYSGNSLPSVTSCRFNMYAIDAFIELFNLLQDKIESAADKQAALDVYSEAVGLNSRNYSIASCGLHGCLMDITRRYAGVDIRRPVIEAYTALLETIDFDESKKNRLFEHGNITNIKPLYAQFKSAGVCIVCKEKITSNNATTNANGKPIKGDIANSLVCRSCYKQLFKSDCNSASELNTKHGTNQIKTGRRIATVTMLQETVEVEITCVECGHKHPLSSFYTSTGERTDTCNNCRDSVTEIIGDSAEQRRINIVRNDIVGFTRMLHVTLNSVLSKIATLPAEAQDDMHEELIQVFEAILPEQTYERGISNESRYTKNTNIHKAGYQNTRLYSPLRLIKTTD